MSIILPQSFNNPALPKSSDVRSILAADAGLAGWFTADSAYVEASEGKIDIWLDRLGRSPRLTRTGTMDRAELRDRQVAGFQAAAFTGANPDDYTFSGAVGAAISAAAIVRMRNLNVANGSGLFSRFTSGTSRLVLMVDNTGRATVMAGGAVSRVPTPVPLDEWLLIVGSYGADNARSWHKGAQQDVVRTTGDTGSGAMHVGTFSGAATGNLDADLAELIIFNRDILAEPDDSAMEAIKLLASRLYGVDLG